VCYFTNGQQLALEEYLENNEVTKFFNRTTRFIHEMWDDMVTMIVIEKDRRMETISKVVPIMLMVYL